MKKILILLLIPLLGLGQDYGNDIDALKLCTVIQNNSFISDSKADNALDRILSVIGASKRFVLQPCDNITNAVATSYKGIRYILYDRDFMDSLDSGDNWSNLFILAHEVGHHINGHSLDLLLYAAEAVKAETLANQREQELEADEFAGFVLGKLGATLKQTSSIINLISSEKDDTYETHPSKSKRLASIEKGYNKALRKEKIVHKTTNTAQTAEEYYYNGVDKAILNDFYGAIADFTKAIEIAPNNRMSYNNRGLAKLKLNDHYGAIADFTKAIEIDPNYEWYYYNRGNSKLYLNDHYGAIADYTKAIEINPNMSEAYNNRGLMKKKLNDHYGAIADFTKKIEIDPNDYTGYYNRAASKALINDEKGACQDARKAKSLGYDADQMIYYACN